jgi:V-type H+-transporting ATPase subunit a
MLVLLGFFSTFCGFMYNDFASIPLGYSTCYTEDGNTQLDGCVHTIGIDPAWYLSEKELPFINGFKMKAAVIFGVAHMSLGIVIKGLNAIHFGRWAEFLFEFIPQIVIMLAMFGYMDLLIVLKWLTDYSGRENEAPSIIQSMIGMFLNGGALPLGTAPLYGSDPMTEPKI